MVQTGRICLTIKSFFIQQLFPIFSVFDSGVILTVTINLMWDTPWVLKLREGQALFFCLVFSLCLAVSGLQQLNIVQNMAMFNWSTSLTGAYKQWAADDIAIFYGRDKGSCIITWVLNENEKPGLFFIIL